jgi:hypothetical protein
MRKEGGGWRPLKQGGGGGAYDKAGPLAGGGGGARDRAEPPAGTSANGWIRVGHRKTAGSAQVMRKQKHGPGHISSHRLCICARAVLEMVLASSHCRATKSFKHSCCSGLPLPKPNCRRLHNRVLELQSAYSSSSAR